MRDGGISIHLRPFVVNVCSDIPGLAADIARIYADFPIKDDGGFIDFHVEVSYETGIRRWFKPLARFYFDGRPSFIPLPADQAFPMFEWGVNWCIAAHSHQYLIIHAAVLERNGHAVMLPAPPGHGKSTLCAALLNSGWRLLSDELALYCMESGEVFGMARPVSLKNRSIKVIQSHFPNAILTTPVDDTTKGTVALLRPPVESVLRVAEPAIPCWIVLPSYCEGADAVLESYSKAQTAILIADQSFNYNVHGLRGFHAVADLVERCDCYQFTYSRFDDAVRVFDSLAGGRAK